MRIGVLGLGRMGGAMAVRLLGAGHALTVLDRHPESQGLFAGVAHQVYGQIIASEDWDRVGVTALTGLKDANLALAAAEAAGVPLPSANVVRDRLVAACGKGDGQRDWAVMAREQFRASGLE